MLHSWDHLLERAIFEKAVCDSAANRSTGGVKLCALITEKSLNDIGKKADLQLINAERTWPRELWVWDNLPLRTCCFDTRPCLIPVKTT